MPAFGGRGGFGGWGGGGQGAKAWGDQAEKTKAAPGSNPLPATSGAPAVQVYGGGFGGGQAQQTPAGQQQGTQAAASTPYAMNPSGHWDIGDQGAEGAWSNGYNPHWAQDPQPAAPVAQPQAQFSPRPRREQRAQVPAPGASQAAAQAAAPQSAASTYHQPGITDNKLYGADGTMLMDYTPNPRGMGGYGDARDNPNNTMSKYQDPTTHQEYYDFDNQSLQVHPGGTLIGKDWASEWDPQGIYKDPTSQFYIPPGDPRWNA